MDSEELLQRLGSIEAKLDVVIRLEERQKNTDESIKRVHKRLDNHGDRLRSCETELGAGKVITSSNTRISWLIVTAVITCLGSIVTGVVVFNLTG